VSAWGPEWETRPRIRPANGIRARSQRGAFAKSWWATRWISALERLVDRGRLTRGRTYARQGQVVKLDVRAGAIDAQVQGSRPTPYRVSIAVPVLSDAAWDRIVEALTERALYAAQLLDGEMPTDIEDVFATAGATLFPSAQGELIAGCSCPDWAELCKHSAAVCYLLGERFDEDPFLMFALRGRDRRAITTALRERRSAFARGEQAEDEHEERGDNQIRNLEPEDVRQHPERFWVPPSDLESLSMNFDPPELDALPIKRLGAPTFAPEPGEFMRTMEQAYKLISDEAHHLALEDL
jgi:uncharacterized Zn finger protein